MNCLNENFKSNIIKILLKTDSDRDFKNYSWRVSRFEIKRLSRSSIRERSTAKKPVISRTRQLIKNTHKKKNNQRESVFSRLHHHLSLYLNQSKHYLHQNQSQHYLNQHLNQAYRRHLSHSHLRLNHYFSSDHHFNHRTNSNHHCFNNEYINQMIRKFSNKFHWKTWNELRKTHFFWNREVHPHQDQPRTITSQCSMNTTSSLNIHQPHHRSHSSTRHRLDYQTNQINQNWKIRINQSDPTWASKKAISNEDYQPWLSSIQKMLNIAMKTTVFHSNRSSFTTFAVAQTFFTRLNWSSFSQC